MVKNPLADAGDMGSIPDPGRSHMLWSNEARAPGACALQHMVSVVVVPRL